MYKLYYTINYTKFPILIIVFTKHLKYTIIYNIFKV